MKNIYLSASLRAAFWRSNLLKSLWQFIVWIACFICLTHPAFSAALSPAESTLRDYANQHQSQQLALLKKLVDINSGTLNITGVNRIGTLLIPEFKQLGFTVRFIAEPKELHRAKTLIAERKGKTGKRLLLIGHLDTVFPQNSPFQQFELKKNSAKGPGVADDKGGLVVMLYALKALYAVHALDDKNITVILTGDEEDSGKPTSISRRPLIEAAKDKDVALDFEPSVSANSASIARRGISMWTLEAHGNEGHSAGIFNAGVGYGAIFELARILNTMRTTLQGEKYLTFNPGVVAAGTKVTFDKKTTQWTVFGKDNIIPNIAFAKGDLRFISPEQQQNAKNKMIAIVKQSLAETKATIVFQEGIPAMPPTEANKKLLEVYSQASDDLGLGSIKSLDPGLRGAGDISHVASMVPANLVGLGPIGYDEHSVTEHTELASLTQQTSRAAVLIYRLTQ